MTTVQVGQTDDCDDGYDGYDGYDGPRCIYEQWAVTDPVCL